MKLENSTQRRLNKLNNYYVKFFHIACTYYNEKHSGKFIDPEVFVRDIFKNYYSKQLHNKVKTSVKSIKENYTNLLSDCIGVYELEILKVVESIQENNTFKMSQAPIIEIPEEIEDLFFEDDKQYKKELKSWFKENKQLLSEKYYNLNIVA